MELKPCPVCGSTNLKYVHYAIPQKYAPDLWEYDEDGNRPLIWLKRIECKECGATVPSLVMSLDHAVEYWNAIKDDETGARYVVQKVMEETVRNNG